MLIKNISVNLFGNLWIVLLTIVSIPILINLLGAESYGMIGFFSTLLAVLSLFDLGLGATLIKIVAKKSTSSSDNENVCEDVRSLELIYWLIGLVVAIVIYASSSYIARFWLNLDSITINNANHAIELMAITIACRWPITFYYAGLMGLEKQVLANSLRVLYETLRILGSILVLWGLKPEVNLFFTWQIFSSLIFMPIMLFFFWRSLSPKIFGHKFNFKSLTKVRRFAGGTAGVTIISAILIQADKVILSGVLPLSQFGYYTLASSAALSLFQLIAPVSAAIFPRFSYMVSEGDIKTENLRSLYHKSCQFISFLAFPAAIIGMLFSKELLFIWTHSHIISDYSSSIFRLLLLGNLLNCLMLAPYAIQLSYGWTSLSLKVSVVTLLIFLPSVYFSALHFGAVGAASTWVALNFSAILITMPLMHKRIFVGDLWVWIYNDILKILLPVVGIAVIASLFNYQTYSTLHLVITIGLFYILMNFSAAVFYPAARAKFNQLVRF